MERDIKKPAILSKIKENFIYQLVLCLVLCVVIIMGYFIISKVIDSRKHREYSIVEDINLVNSIEDIQVDNNTVTLSGYAFMVNKSSNDNLISMFLYNKNNEQEIWLDIERIDRPDVNKYYEGEYNYANSGFLASTKVNKFKQNDVYEAFINIDYTDNSDKSGVKSIRRTVSANIFISNNEIYNYNPNEFDEPDMNVESNLIKNVFANGDVRFYDKDIGVYLYQYQGKLYWIAKDNFDINASSGHMIYHLFTTRIDKLPKHRIQHKFDNLDFYFEKLEYMDEMTVPYRVAIYDIPQEYPITYIRVGQYNAENSKWIWSNSFHLKPVNIQ